MAENEQVRPEADEAEMMRQLREELKNLKVADHLLFMMQSLSALAVDRMGLTEEAGGRRDLDEARLAIDAFRALLDLVGNARPGEDMTAHRSALSQLQMTYLNVLDRRAEETSADAAPESAQETDAVPSAAQNDVDADTPSKPAPDPAAEAPDPAAEAPDPATDAPEGED